MQHETIRDQGSTLCPLMNFGSRRRQPLPCKRRVSREFACYCMAIIVINSRDQKQYIRVVFFLGTSWITEHPEVYFSVIRHKTKKICNPPEAWRQFVASFDTTDSCGICLPQPLILRCFFFGFDFKGIYM